MNPLSWHLHVEEEVVELEEDVVVEDILNARIVIEWSYRRKLLLSP